MWGKTENRLEKEDRSPRNKEWRLQTPFDSLRLVRLYSDCWFMSWHFFSHMLDRPRITCHWQRHSKAVFKIQKPVCIGTINVKIMERWFLYFICIPEWTDSQHLLEVLFSLDPLDSNRRNDESVLMMEWRVINSTKQMGTSGAEYHSDLSKFNVVLMHMVWLTRPDGVIQFGHESISGEYQSNCNLQTTTVEWFDQKVYTDEKWAPQCGFSCTE